MVKGLKYLLWIVVVIFIAIQFVPIDRENPIGDANSDLLMQTQASQEVQSIMRNACYDCHSNETVWPWYSNIAPVSFVIANHIEEGRDHLNFSDWASYDKEDQSYILKNMKKEIDKNAMPLKGYVKMHANAEMTNERKALIFAWIDSVLENYDPVEE